MLFNALQRATAEVVGCVLNSDTSKEATVVETINPGGRGRICLHGVYWRAKSVVDTQKAIPENTTVTIVDRRGLLLIVKPVS